MLKDVFSTAVDTVKENKVVVGVTAGIAIAGVCYWKRKAIVKRYKDAKEALKLAKECAEAELKTHKETNKTKENTIDVESEPVGAEA